VNLTSHLLQRFLKLPPPLTRDVIVERDLAVPMPDGVVLLADRWAPRAGGEGLPTALFRSPYGRRGIIGAMMARPLAERGYQVLIQSTRGGFGSGGTFEPLRHEREDGLATLEWVTKQPWFADSIVLVGESYLGYAQWAVADAVPPQVKAMIPHLTESATTLSFLAKDAFSLETPFFWGVLVARMEQPGGLALQWLRGAKTRRALRTLPLARADVAALGHHSDYIQAMLTHESDDPYWAPGDHRHRVAGVTVPVSSVGGWYDIFLPGQVRDFRVLQEAGRPARLMIGPWPHSQTTNTAILEALEFGLSCARGEPTPRAPVRLYVMGAETWRDFDAWPPSGYVPQRFHLHTGGVLSTEPPQDSEPDSYRYDPGRPTPAVGGARLQGGGRVDNRRLEARSDVLTYTTGDLTADVEIIGEVSAQIWFRSSLRYADVFVRLCDVDPSGRSHNICDGFISLSAADEISCATVALWPTAHRFKCGHRIRIQVSSGAFPRYARNSGTGEAHATATALKVADQSVYHDPEHPSAVILPVRQSRE
jgi:uncharacterized protein